MFANSQDVRDRGWHVNGGEQYDLSSEVDPMEEGFPRSQFGQDLSRGGTPDSFHTGNDSPVIDDGRSAQSSWTNPSYISSVPWGAQAQKRQLERTTTPPTLSEHDYAGTTMVPSTESASSLHKQEIGDVTRSQYPLHRHTPSPTIEIRGFQPVAIPARSTDSFVLEDSPLIMSLKFPSPPEKPSQLPAEYGRSQVTPPARRPITPEPSEPTTPTMLSPETGRFQSSSKSYPSPVQAGFRSPSSRYGAESSGRRSFSGPSFQSARALSFDNNSTPTRLVKFPRDRSRSDSFGSNPEEWQRSTSRSAAIRMPDITEGGRNSGRYSAYGFEVPDFAIDDFDPLSPEAAGRVSNGASNAHFRTAFQLDPAHETPDISISELVSSPPSVDTGLDYETVQTTLVTPEARHFPGIHSPSHASAKQCTSPDIIGLGEGIAGGPQRDERGRRIDLRRWRKADPMLAKNPRTAVDVYTNADPEKQKPGFKKRFSQSVLNLLGETKKSSKNREATADGMVQLQPEPAKKNLKRSVSDLLGLSGKTRTYDWDQPQASHVTLKTRGNIFKRSESSPANLAAIASTRPPLLPFLQRSHRDLPSQQMRKQTSGLPASPSMPALSATLNRKGSPDLRIQNWLNASQAALHDTKSSRYDFGKALSSEDVYEYATGPKSPSITSRILSLRLESRSEVKEESNVPSANRQLDQAQVPVTVYAPPVTASGRHHTTPGTLERGKGQNNPGLDSAVDLTAALAEQDKKRKKRTSLNKFTSWLGFGDKNSKKALAREGSASGFMPSRAISPAIDQRFGTAEMEGSTRKRPPFAKTRSLVPDGPAESDPQSTSKRRSGSDWLGTVGWRRWENGLQASFQSQRKPHIVLLSSEHLPPPTINAQGFLQSTPSRSLLPVPIGQPVHQRLFAQSQDPTADFSFQSPALLAPRMERDLSRLSERDEEDVSRPERLALPSVVPPTPGHSGRNTRKPLLAFSDVSTQDRYTLAVPVSDFSRRRSSGADNSRKVLSITSLSSISTGLGEGEDHGATIQTVLASPIHHHTPTSSAPVVSRGVSLDLAVLTDAEKLAVGFGATPRRAVAI